ncbi:MAG TPA: hypothetical protein VFQ44_31175 [Streptosporangiaceae bacterium]|nr:hypothetical protein [Streptosporangiaceae bacterium]
MAGFTTPAGLAVAALAVVIAGCSSAPNGKPAGKGTEAVSAESKAASHALQLAAYESQRVKSVTAKIIVHSKGSGAAAGNLTGTVDMQLKPKTMIKATFKIVSAKARPIELDEILTGKAIYFQDPSFTKAAGKPWVVASLSELSSKVGVSLGSLLQNLESSNPLDQARLFVASKNAHLVGPAVIHGVHTTEYAGTYSPAAALAQLTPKLRKLMGPALGEIGTNPVQFEVWVDAQHRIRRARDTDNVRGQIVTTTLNVTSVNKPVHITLPSPGEVAPLPKI